MREFILPFLLALLAAPVHADEKPSRTLILEDIAIVDVENAIVLAPRSVLIEHGRISEIAKSPKPDWPSVERPDVAGLYLSPALYDAHAHIYDERDLRMYALGGIQVVRNMDGWPWHIRLREANGDPQHPRARLLTVGSQFQQPEISTASDAKIRIRNEREAGYDWIKLYDDLPMPALEGIASQHDLLVTGHTPSGISVPDILDLGVFDDIAHAEELSHAWGGDYPDGDAGLDALARDMKKSGTALTTTIVNNQMIAEQAASFEENIARPEVGDAPPLLQAFWRSTINPWNASHDAGTVSGLEQQVQTLKRLVFGLAQRGVVLLAGTDAPNPTTVPARSLHQELAILVESGLTPAQALRSATTDAADHLEPGHRGARIEVGATANFILTRHNPLEEIGTLARYEALVINGDWLTRSSAEEQRDQLRQAYAQDLTVLSEFAPDSPAGVLEAMNSGATQPAISSEGLTSLVWFYMKIGNLAAALAVSERLVETYPSANSNAVREYIATQSP